MSISSVLSCPVLGATTNADSIVVFDHYFDALDALLVNELADSAKNVQPAKLSHYHRGKV